MLGFLARVVAAPIRLANIPLKVASKVADAMCGQRYTAPLSERDPLCLEEVADAVEGAIRGKRS